MHAEHAIGCFALGGFNSRVPGNGKLYVQTAFDGKTMIRRLLMMVVVCLVCGCGVSRVKPNIDGFVPFAQDLQPLIGKWESDGQLALIVEQDGNRIAIRNPENEVWRFEVEDVHVDANSIRFVQRSFLIDGSTHPFNGVPCECKISAHASDPDLLIYQLTSEHSKDIPPSTMRRAK